MPSTNPESYEARLTDGAFDPGARTDNAAIEVILAESQAIYRVGIRKIFALEDDIRVIAQVDSLAGLRGAVERFTTGILLLEWNLIAGSKDAITEMVRAAPQLKIIVHSDRNEQSNTIELYHRGVRGIIPRSISPELLVKCVRKIAAGETWIDNQSIGWVIEAYRLHATGVTTQRSGRHLTPKELAIITGVTQGKRNKEIAYELGTTEQVIKNYLRKVYDKLGVSDRLELALYCLRHHLGKKPNGVTLDASTEASHRRIGGA